MGKKNVSVYAACLVSSMVLNLFLIINLYVGEDWKLSISWSKKAAAEAEAVAAISCSGHGRAYLDGLLLNEKGSPVCECNSCYGGPDCSDFSPACAVNADGGDPLFLEPFWRQHAESSAVVVAGWHRMGYSYSDHTYICQELERHVRILHSIVKNAVTAGRYIVFGAGSTQLLNAAVNALSAPHNSSMPASIVASIPYYPVYKKQTDIFQSINYKFEGDASLWKNSSSDATVNHVIEFVTSPNNPDGQPNKAVVSGPNAKAIHDHAYYWPHFSPIPTPADEDVMLFTISKLTGHASTRFGWAIIKDKAVYERMIQYMNLNSYGVSRDSQLRALKLLKVVIEGGGREIFEFGYTTMRDRWQKLSEILSMSKRFSLQKIAPQYCSFLHQVRESSPAYAWVKCEREEDRDCHAVLQGGNINSRKGSVYSAEDRYVRLSLIRRQDDFDLLLQHLNKLMLGEDGAKPL